MEIPAGIFAFVCVRSADGFDKSLLCSVEKRLTRDGGCVVPPPEGIDLCAAYPLISQALVFIRFVQETAAKAGLRPAIGLECGEVPAGASLKRLLPLTRAEQLAAVAWEGQNLIGPTAKEIARPTLPAGFGIIELGELKLGGSISADKVCQLSISGFKSDFERQPEFEDVESNVPDAPDGFIGRDTEARQVRKALTDTRLVSLIGPAGVGKSALAHWLAADLMEAYRDGSWKIDLAKIPKGGSVATAIAADLKLPAMANHTNEERVLISLATMDGLIWLDNCEHVIEEARALLPKIFLSCPKVTILVTSQIPLRIDGEIPVNLSPFEVPPHAEDFYDVEAVRLFINRARRSKPDVTFGPSDLPIVAEICRKVDGLPLAIELAAAQVAKHSVADLRDRVFDALRDSTAQAGRFKTLDRALEWSYSLLGDKEKKFLRALGVLAGPTNRDLVLRVAASTGASSDAGERMLDTLVSASLVQASKQGATRYYKLLEPVRQFALLHLERNGEDRNARNRFAKACLDWLIELRLTGVPLNRWLATVGRESSNLAEALNWLLDDPRQGSTALCLCVELYDLWINRGPYDLAYTWFSRAAERGKPPEGVPAGDIQNWVGVFAGYAGRFEESVAHLEKAIALWERVDNKRRKATAHTNLAWTYRNNGRYEEAVAHSMQSLEGISEEDPRYGNLLSNHAWQLLEAGMFEQASEAREGARRTAAYLNDPIVRARIESQQAQHDLFDNKTESAERNIAQSLASYREAGNVQAMISLIELAGIIALRLGHIERAAKLFGGSARQYFQHGFVGLPVDVERRDRALADIEGSVGREHAEALYAEGALMTFEELYDYARSPATAGFVNLTELSQE